MTRSTNDQPRVLIIEDNDAVRAMLFTILRHQPLGVDTATTLDAAVEKVLSCDYALILIDMNFCGNRGERFMREFRERRPEATSFVIAIRDPQQEVFIDSEVAVAVLNKPIEIDMLGEVVRECAFLVPKPEEPLQCPPAENDIRARFERGSLLSN